MPKSFLVKNKKARRAEDEIQDSTKAAQDEDKPPGKGKLQTSLQAKIALVAVSTWLLTNDAVRSFLCNIYRTQFTVIKCHSITSADVGEWMRTVL